MKECITRIIELEELFSDNKYNGAGETAFRIEEGRVPVMISAPHAVNHYREEKIKWADRYTGGIAKYLHEVTGCHLIYSCMYTESDPNFDNPDDNKYQQSIVRYSKNHDIKFLIDLHGASKERVYAVELGTAPLPNQISGKYYEEDPSLHQYKFVAEEIKNIFEDAFKELDLSQKEVWKNIIFDAGKQNTVTKYISENTNIPCIQFEINGNYRDPKNEDSMIALINALIEIIKMCSALD